MAGKNKQFFLNQVRTTIQDAGLKPSHEHIVMDAAFVNVGFIAVEEAQSKIIVGGLVSGNHKFTSRVVSVDEIMGVQILEDGKDIANIGNTLGMAAVGGLMFGGAGAIVGAISGKENINKVSNVSLVIAIDDLTTPFITLSFLAQEADKGMEEYKNAYTEAHKWAGIINILISRREKARLLPT